MLENKVQADCVMWFSQEFPERRGDLFATFQEVKNPREGAARLTMGLVPGVSDLILLNNGVMTGIEMKAPDSKHDIYHILEQCRFILNNCYDGWFCNTLPMFEDIVNKTGRGIDPLDVIDWCIDVIAKKTELTGSESIDDLLYKINEWRNWDKKKSIGKVKF